MKREDAVKAVKKRKRKEKTPLVVVTQSA